MTLTTHTPPATTDAVALRIRLRTERTGRGALLDGGWWPRSTDPAAELAALIPAIDDLHGPVLRVALRADGWDSRPRRLTVAGRTVHVGYFTSQPAHLFTARCDDGGRVDLMIVPPDTDPDAAASAMAQASEAENHVHTEDILTTVEPAAPRTETRRS